MTGNGQRLCKEVRHAVKAADEEDTEVSLADPVPDPVQAHVRGLGHTLGDGVGRDADGHLIVAKQRGGRLGVGGDPCWPRFCVPLSRCGQRRISQRTPPPRERNKQ